MPWRDLEAVIRRVGLTRLWPDTLAGRIVVVLMLSLGLLHVLSIWMYYAATIVFFEMDRTRELADRLLAAERILSVAPSEQRDAAAHALSREGFDVHWEGIGQMRDVPQTVPPLDALRDKLIDIHPILKQRALYVGGHHVETAEHPPAPSSRYLLQVSFELADGSRIAIATDPVKADQINWIALLLSSTAMAVGILIVSVILVRSVTAPWRLLAQAAQRAGIDTLQPVIPETGPLEVRRAARAFNDMLARIKLLVVERAQTLAAIAHDLRTPLTRQRLRLEFIEDAELRERMQVDLDDMEAMVNSSLEFLRGDRQNEELRSIDITAVLASICGDLADAGHQVQLAEHPPVTVLGRPLALKRAFGNLLDNAVKYGRRVHVSLNAASGGVLIAIEDDGPGIPADHRERVFEPFYRIEGSRSRETGGVGLGLTVARTLILAHGGTIRLDDRRGGGLRVDVTLPTVFGARE